jgi:hypothetical protein
MNRLERRSRRFSAWESKGPTPSLRASAIDFRLALRTGVGLAEAPLSGQIKVRMGRFPKVTDSTVRWTGIGGEDLGGTHGKSVA